MIAPRERGGPAGPPFGEPKPTTDAAGKISYYSQVRPILQTHCNGCHQPAKRGGEYVMTEFAGLLKGGESGEAAVSKVLGDLGITPAEDSAPPEKRHY